MSISGQVGWDTNEKAAGGLAAQTRHGIDNLELVIKSASGTLSHIVALRIYVRAELRDDLQQITFALKNRFPEDPPVSSWIGVATLSRDDILIEAEATAILP